MSSSALAAGLRHLRGQLAVQQKSDDSDERLLHAFTTRRDDNAFAVLVRRHGPMVLHVCRRVLGHEQDAEDAFQATFLVLARKATSLLNKASLASFFHGIAYRTALKAKQAAACRRKYERSLGALTQPRSPTNPAGESSWREAKCLLDEEIARLSDIYRVVFVHFYLEDHSQAETARRLGLKVATVEKRLAEARKRLGQRLRRRGVELTAVLAAMALATRTALALPAGLMATTIKAASAMAAGGGLADVASVHVIELVKDENPIRGRIIDLQGKPVSGVRVRIADRLATPKKGDLTAFLAALKTNKDHLSTVETDYLTSLYSPALDLLLANGSLNRWSSWRRGTKRRINFSKRQRPGTMKR